MQAAIDAPGAKWSRFFAGVDTKGLLRQMQIVRSGGGVYSRTALMIQRSELLRVFGLAHRCDACVGCGIVLIDFGFSMLAPLQGGHFK